MERKDMSLWLTVVILILAFDCGNCNIQQIGKMQSIRSNAVIRVENNPQSVLDRQSRSLHRFRRSVLNATEMKEALDAHNRLRRSEGASNMELMTWSNSIASKADAWANKCLWQHEPRGNSTTLPSEEVGQNLYFTTGTFSIASAIMAWYNEKQDFNYDTLACQPDKMCGHYTQVVWASSWEVGCAYALCSTLRASTAINATFFVCYYGPAGNVQGLKPFRIGTACSSCASGSWWCNEGLCDRSCTTTGPTCGCAPVCANSGSVNSATCSCSCAPGWYGSDCSLFCKDYDPLCDPEPGKLGYLPSLCTDNAYGVYIREKCPKMCQQCQAIGDATSTKPSLLSMLAVLLSWLLLNSFRSI